MSYFSIYSSYRCDLSILLLFSHLSPGQTTRSTRGFKWNTDQNNNQQFSEHLKNGFNKELNPLSQTQQKSQPPYENQNYYHNDTNNNNNNNQTANNSNIYPYGVSTPQKQLGSPRGWIVQQKVTDFNYIPSHQKPLLQTSASTAVTSHEDIRQIVEVTLGLEAVLNQAVKLPKGENENEWLAVHVVDFYNQINMLYGTITEFCSPITCPRMIATNEYEYLWSFEKGAAPVSVSAPKYVECLMGWCQDQFDDENIFPCRKDGEFPERNPEKIVIPMLRRLFRIYAHIYCHHFNEIIELNLQTVLNTSFGHFILFAQEFNLLRPADYGPLLELVIELRDR